MKASRRDRRDAMHLWRLCVVDGVVDERRARQVVSRIVDSGHSHGPAILSHFLRLLRQERSRHSACVESATPLDVRLRADIDERVVDRYGHAVMTTFAVVPALIGGIRVTVGSDVYDGSVRGRLDALAARFEGQR
jgi:F-type H+-transporting ATPase subunit delta